MTAETGAELRGRFQRIIIGKDELIDRALAAILCGAHILIEDGPGIGKTILARAPSTSVAS